MFLVFWFSFFLFFSCDIVFWCVGGILCYVNWFVFYDNNNGDDNNDDDVDDKFKKNKNESNIGLSNYWCNMVMCLFRFCEYVFFLYGYVWLFCFDFMF